jgi:hypothetical protein
VVRRTVVLLALAVVAAACGSSGLRETEADGAAPPEQGACRDLLAENVERPANATPAVPCSQHHTAQTFAVGTLPADAGTAYDDKSLGKFVFGTCSAAFRSFLGLDESLALRVQLSWAWFRPSERGWRQGARWYRCDVVGGPHGAKKLRALPSDAHGLFSADLPDAWLTCARGSTIPKATKVPCSETHDWRAVSTIKVGLPQDPYPGDRIVQVRSRDRCSDWVAAWTHYAPNFDYGYTWFHEAEWATGNRRSICWARTDA